MIDVFLVLTHADARRIYLDEFCQRVHQSTTYADGSANGYILVWELFSCNLTGTIDAGTVFAHAINLHIIGKVEVTHEVLSLSTSCSVADTDGLNAIFLDEILNGQHRLNALSTRGMREDDVVMQEIAFRIEADHLATCSEAWVNRHNTLLSEGRSHEQLFQIANEDSDGFCICFLLGRSTKLVRDAGLEQSLVTVLDSFLHSSAALIVASHELTCNSFHSRLIIYTNRDTQDAFSLTSSHSQQTMAGAAF